MLTMIGRWRAHGMGRKAVRRLYPILIRRYGKDERYTPGQVDRAMKISGLGRRYRPYAHAVFTNPDELGKLDSGLQRKVLPLTRSDNGLGVALQMYALAILPMLHHSGEGIDGGGLFDGGGSDGGGAGDGGGGAGGNGGGGDGG